MLKAVNISNPKRTIFIIICIVAIGIVFESFQQLYYINRYQLSTDTTFFGLLKFQALRWVVWLLYSFILIGFSKKQTAKKALTTLDIVYYFILICSLVFFAIISISVIQLLLSPESFSFHILYSEYIPFFTFQKAPIYTLGYIAIAIILHFHFTNEQLQIHVRKLFELKNSHTKEYEELRSKIDDKAKILTIKIGNNHKIIPVNNINWIESDDYCVKVHTTNGSAYSMRSSLKALEKKLNGQFLRVHRKAIVNMQMVTSLNNSNSPSLILKDNSSILISKSNLKKVKNYWQQKTFN